MTSRKQTRWSSFLSAVLTAAGLLLLPGVIAMTPARALAQAKFDPAAFEALADAGSSDTIPPGTRITLQNWQQ